MTSQHMDCATNGSDAKFHFLIDELLSIIKSKDADRKLVDTYFNKINAFDFGNVDLTNKNVLLLVKQLCEIVPTAEEPLVQNVCQLLTNLMKNNGEIICSPTCTRFLLNALESSMNNEILSTLQIYLSVSHPDINDILHSLLLDKGKIRKYLTPQQFQWCELNYQAINCLENIFKNKDNISKIHSNFISITRDIILKILSLPRNMYHDTQFHSKIVSSCLCIYSTMISEDLIEKSSQIIGEALGIAQAYLFYGIKDYAPIEPQFLHPAAMNLPEPVHELPKCKNLKIRKVKPRRTSKGTEPKNSTLLETTQKNNLRNNYKYSSDSDTPDGELSNFNLDSKVRLAVLHLLQTLVEKKEHREIFGYWPQIVATGSRNDARVLSRLVQKETNSKVRQNALMVLGDLLTGARTFLIHAEESQESSFITFFGTVCLMIKELHLSLSRIVNKERNAVVLTHALKCIGSLIQGTPYGRLKSGLATKLIETCRPHLFHKDPTVRVGALSVFEILATNDPITPEIFSILAQRDTISKELEKLQISANSASDIGTEEEIDIEDAANVSFDYCNEYKFIKDKDISFLVHICLCNISDETMNIPVRLQSIKLLGRMAFATRTLVFPHLEIIAMALISTMNETEFQIIRHATRTLEIMAGCLANWEECDKGLMFWNIIFDSMCNLAQHSQEALREAACDCLGSIDSSTITQLPRQKIIIIITILFGTVRDEESAVRAAAVRALGMLVTQPPLQEDAGFLMDLADIVVFAGEDQSLGVRVKGAWAMANLCDCLVKVKEQEDVDLDVLLPKLYEASVKLAKDNNKVKCNAVRAVGTILHLCSDRRQLKDTSLGLDVLVSCATTGCDMKVRWNACRALGLVLSHNPDNILPSLWKDQVLPALCSLITQSPNFKVRTNAAWAISSCLSFGKYTATIWRCIALALENSQHVPSYTEYSHRDALIQQLCLTLCHVATCTTESELPTVWKEIGDYIDEICHYIKHFQESILLEKLGDLIKAKAHLDNLVKTVKSTEERRIAESLANIFERTNYYDNIDVQ